MASVIQQLQSKPFSLSILHAFVHKNLDHSERLLCNKVLSTPTGPENYFTSAVHNRCKIFETPLETTAQNLGTTRMIPS